MTRHWLKYAFDALLGPYRLARCIALAASLSACVAYPSSDERFDDQVVATGYDKSVDFSLFKTFAIDPVVHVIQNGADDTPELGTLDPKYADPIVAQVEKNMIAAGYQKVNADEYPNVGLSLTGINTLVTGTYTAWWGYGYYWGYPGYGYYYPYYYGYAYRAGSLITQMVDLTKSTPARRGDAGTEDIDGGPYRGLPVAWSSIGYRVLEDSGTANLTWAKSSIDQAFLQSPYLGTK
jgi:hypothetical protein